MRERERDRESERQRVRETESQRDRETDRQRLFSSYRIGMRSVLVFGSIGGVTEGLCAPGMFAHVRFFSRVRPQMSFEVLEPTVSFAAAFERAFVRLLAGVAPHVHHQHILRLEKQKY